MPAGAPELPSVLVLGGAYDGGGHSDESEREGDELTLDRGDPIPGGLFSPCLLTFTTRDGSCCKWRQAEANGDAPAAIWHHSASSFRSGTRVVVFGGDMPEADPEMVDFISDRTSASAVYVLDVGTLNWSRVMCKGDPPSWRSLHVGLSFSPFGRGNKSPFGDPNGEGGGEQGGNEQLIVLGGTDEHTACFSSGAPGDFVPRTLDLVTFNWQEFPPPPEDALQATRRMRFAAEIYGERLLIYSGHGDDPLPASQRLVALHLRTMRWEQMRVRNRPICFADTPSACLSGGLIVGGVQMSFFGIRPCSKLDVLCLAEPPLDPSDAGEDEDGGQGGDHGGDHKDEHKGDDHKGDHRGDHKSDHRGDHKGDDRGDDEGDDEGDHKGENTGEGKGQSKGDGASSSNLGRGLRWEGAPGAERDEEEADADDEREQEEENSEWGRRLVTVQLVGNDGVRRTRRLPLALAAILAQMAPVGGEEEDGEEDENEEDEVGGEQEDGEENENEDATDDG